MVMQNPFTTTNQVLANYSYSDISSGVGYIDYYLFNTIDNSATEYKLITSTPYSADISVQVPDNGVGTSFEQTSDIDFDNTEFSISQTIKGTAIINIPWITNGDNTNSFQCYLICKIRKWDGTTETDIASVQTTTLTQSATTAATGIFSLNITIPQTQFEVGDILRLTIEGWMKQVSSNVTKTFLYGIDPLNRTKTISGTDMDTTTSKISIPFKIDL